MQIRPPFAPRPLNRAAMALGLAWALAVPGTGWTQNVVCHLAYAGASRSFTIAPTNPTDEVLPLVEGASFNFQVINRLPPEPGAGVQINTYAVLAGQPLLVHRASYLGAEAPAAGLHGFTGLQVVREPLRQHELSYWCERAGR